MYKRQVPNYGAEEDYAGLDLTGKIALVQRGGGMYYEQKERNAAKMCIRDSLCAVHPGHPLCRRGR